MRSFLLFLLVLSGIAPLPAQRGQLDYQAEVLHKPLFLRGLWEKNDLHFRGDGTLAGKSGLTSPLLSSVEITEVDLQPDRLILTGRRLATVYDGPPKLLDIKQPVHIVISQTADGDYDRALEAILTPKMSDLATAAPEFWRSFLTGSSAPKPPVVRDTTLSKIGGGVTPPIVTYLPEPNYSEEARRVKLGGNVLVTLHVDPHGVPTHIQILRPLGMGLDENAVASVAKYRFKPAKENGQTVEMQINVEVNFQSF